MTRMAAITDQASDQHWPLSVTFTDSWLQVRRRGQYALWEAIVPPGGGPPPHTHSREEEGFYVLEGEITFYVEGQPFVATAGILRICQSESNIASRTKASLPRRC